MGFFGSPKDFSGFDFCPHLIIPGTVILIGFFFFFFFFFDFLEEHLLFHVQYMADSVAREDEANSVF